MADPKEPTGESAEPSAAQPGRVRRLLVLLAALLALAVVVTAVVLVVRRVTADPLDRYCDLVVEKRPELTDELSRDSSDTFIRALPIFEDLQSRAPDDVVDEWAQVTNAIRGLRDALDDAGVDAATYDRDDLPDGVTAKEKTAIDAAARELGSAATADALAGVDQEARDVCQTPLFQ